MIRGISAGCVIAMLAGTPVAMADVHDFPSAGSAVVGSVGFINDEEIGFFWSADRGDSVEERFSDPQPSIGSVKWEYDVVTNGLLEPLVWVMLINGTEVGKFEVQPGDLGPQSLEFDFSPVSASRGSYAVRIEARSEVSPGAGAHTLRYALAGPHQITLGDGGGGPTCYADCDENSELDFFDFLCFQNAFSARESYADCDENSEFDFFDFLCFQNEFSAGCDGELELREYGVEAPPSSDCGTSITAFPEDGRPDFTVVTDVPSPLSGEILFDIPMSKRTVPASWLSWSHGYTGSVYYTQGLNEVNMGIPGNSAFYFYVEPNPFEDIEFEITGESGGTEVSAIDTAHGQSGAKGFGFCGGVENVNVRTTDGITDFAVGEFGIAD